MCIFHYSIKAQYVSLASSLKLQFVALKGITGFYYYCKYHQEEHVIVLRKSLGFSELIVDKAVTTRVI